MDILLNEDEVQIWNAADAFLSSESPPSLVRGVETGDPKYAPDLWAGIAAQGWCGLCLPEEIGGQGAPLTWMGILLEAVGRHIAPVPLAAVAAASLVTARFGNTEQRRYLRQVASGSSLVTYALQEGSADWDIGAVQMSGRVEGDEVILSGTKSFVENFFASDRCLVVFRGDLPGGADGISVALVDTRSPGLHGTALVNTAKTGQSFVTFDGVRIPIKDVLGELGRGRAAADYLAQLASVFLASQMAGAARRATEFAVEYSKVRVAFEQPIGAFQALQHLAADMIIAVDGTEMLAREALWRLDNGLDATMEVSQAKSFANEHCLATCRSAQQIHGGIGFIKDFDLHLWYKRVATWALTAGTTYDHRKKIAEVLLDRAGTVRLDDCHYSDSAEARELVA